MKLLTKNSDYAIRALVVLVESKKEFLSSREIAQSQNIPYQFLRRIMRELIESGLVASREGGLGGFKLRKSPESISIVDVIRIFQGDVRFSQCMFRKKLCGNRSVCVLRKEINRIEHIVEKEFGNISIAMLSKGL
jgi:Rrf2 family cysteine metabolism transcriptional repressor